MKTITCSKCRRSLDVKAFYERDVALSRYNCRECISKYHKERIKDPSIKKLKHTSAYQSIMNRKKVIQDYKEANPCTDCKQKYPYYVMEFDHLRDKKADVSSLVRSGCLNKAWEEIAKCDLVCSNCHAIRTYSRLK